MDGEAEVARVLGKAAEEVVKTKEADRDLVKAAAPRAVLA